MAQGDRNEHSASQVLSMSFDEDAAAIKVTGATGSSSNTVQGTAADNAAAVGNPVRVGAKYNSSTQTYADGDIADNQADVNGNLKTTTATLMAGEDLTNDVMKVEQRFSYSGIVTSDTAVKSGAGFVHNITFSCTDAAPTVGTIAIRDATAAGAGTIIYTLDVIATTWFAPITIPLDVSFATGLFVDFTTTADVNVVCSYR